MSKVQLIKNVQIVNEGKIFDSDLLIKNSRIEKISSSISHKEADIIEGNGLFLIPGCIDDQVHFREPGLTHKGDIYSESRAAVAGGVTSFMEMPNTIPNALTIDLLESKYSIASEHSLANYSFYMGTSNSNLDEILKIDNKKVCGVKVFMGSSTGNMLVDDEHTLNQLFAKSNSLIAVHCEDEKTIKFNQLAFNEKYGNKLSSSHHPLIRSREACFKSSSYAVQLAKKHGTRLHILHISSMEELELFENKSKLIDKRITSEACVHHLYFSDDDYNALGNLIKCNPAIKTNADRAALRKAVENGFIDVIATDHAPHTLAEKNNPYNNAPSGLPLVQHSLQVCLTIAEENKWPLTFVIDKMSHSVAECFKIKERGYIREGYFADLVLLDSSRWQIIEEGSLLYKCQWSPLTNRSLKGLINKTWVNGNLVFDNSQVNSNSIGSRLEFNNI
ncbi:MAG: dihydroorotase [Saprospiraceae bacterium]|nr:dihydroorotase [Saprospiraceae bacterium]